MSENSTQPGVTSATGRAVMARFGAAVPRADFWIFVGLLALAIIGAAVSAWEVEGGWRYWTFLVLTYAVVGVARSWYLAKGQGESLWSLVRTQVLHWAGALVAIEIVLLFESSGGTDRGLASDDLLLVLALSTYLAGVHINWTYMLLGGVLAVIAMALQTLQQDALFLVIPLALVAAWAVYRR